MSDLIDREQAIEKIKEAADNWLISNRNDSYWKGFSMGTHIAIQTIVHEVPSTEKAGKWLIPQRKDVVSWNEKAYAECSVCHNIIFDARSMKFCPQCGARMEIE